jgi:hypothetical protein
MPIPTRADQQLAEIDDLRGAIMVRLRVYRYAGKNRNPASIREALVEYANAVTDLVNEAL